jgi:hypothetical protein
VCHLLVMFPICDRIAGRSFNSLRLGTLIHVLVACCSGGLTPSSDDTRTNPSGTSTRLEFIKGKFYRFSLTFKFTVLHIVLFTSILVLALTLKREIDYYVRLYLTNYTSSNIGYVPSMQKVLVSL